MPAMAEDASAAVVARFPRMPTFSGETQRADRVRVRAPRSSTSRSPSTTTPQTLPQLAAHFYRQSVEERNHAMMMVQYLLDSGDEVVDPGRRGAADRVRRRRRPGRARARPGEARHRADLAARRDRAGGRRPRRASSSCTGSCRSSARRSRRCRRCCRSWSGCGTTSCSSRTTSPASRAATNPLEAGAPPAAGGAL